jgi:hypothetical protein
MNPDTLKAIVEILHDAGAATTHILLWIYGLEFLQFIIGAAIGIYAIRCVYLLILGVITAATQPEQEQVRHALGIRQPVTYDERARINAVIDQAVELARKGKGQ